MVPGMILLVVVGPFFLRILGSSYAAHGSRLLQLVALAFPFMAVNVLYVTFARLARRVRRVFGVQAIVAAVVLGLTYVLLPILGLNGAGVAYLSGQALMAVCVFPSVRRQFRRVDMAPDFAAGATLVARNAAEGTSLGGDADGPAVGDRPTT
jgi:O-antigen/teichoic acid export membrane protein